MSVRGVVARLLTVPIAVTALMLGPATASASTTPPIMTRGEIIARAETALGLSYSWGRESWIPNTGSGKGSDCSGFVLKCWEVPKTLLYQEEHGVNATIYPRYTTYHFYNCLGPWYALKSRADLVEGDILVKRSGGSGHVVLYAGGDSWNYPIIYEAPGTGLTIRRTSRYLGSEYLPRRRTLLHETTSIILDNPTAKSAGGTDISGNWARSTYFSGFYGDNYQATMGTSSESWARWTPRIPASGYYDVYIRWTSGASRAPSVKLKMRGDIYTHITTINQRVGGGEWHWLGRNHFRKGYSLYRGSVIIYATGAVGGVCADAVKFVPVVLD